MGHSVGPLYELRRVEPRLGIVCDLDHPYGCVSRPALLYNVVNPSERFRGAEEVEGVVQDQTKLD